MNKVEPTVIDLIIKLNKENVTIDASSKEQITKALLFYKKKIHEEPEGEMPSHVSAFIDIAIEKVNQLPVSYNVVNIGIEYGLDLCQLEQVIDSYDITEEKYRSIIGALSLAAKKLDDEVNKFTIFNLSLKLFLKYERKLPTVAEPQKVSTLQRLVHRAKGKKPKTSSTSQVDKLSQKIDLYEEIVEKLSYDSEKDTVHKLTKAIKNLLVSNYDIRLHIRLENLLEKLKHLNRKHVENNFFLVIQSNKDFTEKKVAWEKCRKAFAKSDEKKKRIYGFFLLEVAKYFKEIQITLDQYRTNAEKFAFPKRSSRYQTKREEILLLSYHLKDLPEGFRYVEKKVQLIEKEIKDIVEILDKRAEENEKIISAFDKLKSIEENINKTESCTFDLQDKMRLYKKYRLEIYTIQGSDQRVLNRRQKVLTLLDCAEEAVIKQTQTFLQDQASDEDKQVVRELKSYVSTGDQKDGLKEELDRIEDNVNGILKYNIHRKRKVIQMLQKQKERIEQLSPITPNEVERIERIKSLISTKELKMRLTNVSNNLDNFVKEIATSMSTEEFEGKINKLFYEKDKLDNVVTSSDQKQALLEKFYKAFELFDESLAKAVANGAQGHLKILELRKHFGNINFDEIDAPKESHEFIQKIHEKAQSYEESANYYLGTNYSVDYFLIHENLMRLLEKLDTINCKNDEELLTAVINTMEYIKSLLNKLELNALSD